MIAARVLASSAVRLAAAFTILFALGGALMFGAFQLAVVSFATASIDDDLRVETRGLLSSGSQRQLTERVSARVRIAGPFVYGLFDEAGQKLAGELSQDTPLAPGFSEILLPAPVEDAADDERVAVRILATRLPEGVLVVGKTTYAVQELREWMAEIALWGVAGMALLAAIGGLAVGIVLVRRLDRVNAATARIMAGHLGDRLPPIGLGPEFEALRDNLNRMLERLEASMDAIRHVSSDVAHDLRTPLNRLRQRLEHARSHQETVSGLQSAIDRALLDLDQTLDIFSALLRIAQIEAGTGRDAFAPVSLPRLVRRVVDAYLPVAEQAGHTLTMKVDGRAEISGDEDLLVQMLSNLIENAIVHSSAPIQIQVAVRDEGAAVVLEVRDTGPGIPEPELEKVKRRFYRLDRSRHSAGSGLGLALVAAIAALHQAELALTINRPGLSARIAFPASGRPESVGSVSRLAP